MELLLTPARTTSLSSATFTTTTTAVTLLSSSNLHHHNSHSHCLVRSLSASTSDDDIFLSSDTAVVHEKIHSWYSHQTSSSSSPSMMSTPLPLISSGPMVIPTKGSSRSRGNHYKNNKHTGVAPAVAALLAVTAIPPPGSRKQRVALRQQQQQRPSPNVFIESPTPSDDIPLSFDDALGESVFLGLESVALSRDPSRDSTRSSLSLLLGPPDYDDDTSCSLQKSPSDSHLSVRSDSSDSVPSLEDDDRSTFSWSSFQSLPLPRKRPAGDPRARILASNSEECHFDHPLMFDSDDDTAEPALEPELGFFSEDALKRVTRRLNFKSNLTASIRVLKSAARSFSSISVAAPFTQPDDYLTRSILSISPQFTDEKRPALSLDTPTPALRRYLNPTNATPDSPCTGAIQMQTYSSSQKPSKETHKDASVPNSRVSNPAARPREVRENGDFLRVIVLEMNMRRRGKLSDTAHGKAKIALPPRQPYKYRVLGDARRWEAWTCSYDE